MPVEEPLTLQRHGLMGAEFGGPEVAREYGPLISQQVEDLSSIIEVSREEISKVDADQGLNGRGKADRISQLYAKTKEQIDTLNATRRRKLDADLELALSNIPKRLPVPPAADIGSLTDSAIQGAMRGAHVIQDSLKLQEIRQHLLGMAPGLRKAAIVSAAEMGDLDLLRAVEGAPKVLNLVDADAFAAAKERWLELTYPEQFEKVNTIRSALSLFEGNVQQAREAIRSVAPKPAPRAQTLKMVS